MMWMSESGIPAARNWSASNLATRGTSPRLWTLGISIACLNTSRVFVCQAGGSCVGTVRGSTAAKALVANEAESTNARARFIQYLLFAGEVTQHQLPMDDIVVQRLDRDSLVFAVGTEVGRDLYPGSVGAVNRNSRDAERPRVARPRRH